MSVRHQDILMPPQTDGELFTSRLRVLHTSASQPKKLPFPLRNTDCDSQSERALSESITPITAMERFNSSFAEGETRDWTFPELDGSGNRRYVRLWVESADLYPGYGNPIHNVGTYYWDSNQTKVISATQTAQTFTITYNANGGSGAPAHPNTLAT